MDKQIVEDALALTPMQEYWLAKMEEAYKEFTKFGGYIINGLAYTISDMLFSRPNIKRLFTN